MDLWTHARVLNVFEHDGECETPWWALNSRHQIDRFDARDLREAVLHMLLCVLSKPAFKMMMLMSCSHALSASFCIWSQSFLL